MDFTQPIYIRWSDIDANYHLRHSAYYDFGAQQRVEILSSLGITLAVMQEQHLGPVLFREECIFKKEIRLEDVVFISTALVKMKQDGSRFIIRHELKNEAKLFAIITVEGAWMDTKLRKLCNPLPPHVMEAMSAIQKSEDFELIPA